MPSGGALRRLTEQGTRGTLRGHSNIAGRSVASRPRATSFTSGATGASGGGVTGESMIGSPRAIQACDLGGGAAVAPPGDSVGAGPRAGCARSRGHRGVLGWRSELKWLSSSRAARSDLSDVEDYGIVREARRRGATIGSGEGAGDMSGLDDHAPRPRPFLNEQTWRRGGGHTDVRSGGSAFDPRAF